MRRRTAGLQNSVKSGQGPPRNPQIPLAIPPRRHDQRPGSPPTSMEMVEEAGPPTSEADLAWPGLLWAWAWAVGILFFIHCHNTTTYVTSAARLLCRYDHPNTCRKCLPVDNLTPDVEIISHLTHQSPPLVTPSHYDYSYRTDEHPPSAISRPGRQHHQVLPCWPGPFASPPTHQTRQTSRDKKFCFAVTPTYYHAETPSPYLLLLLVSFSSVEASC
ncbi:uncharacterized protein J3D65DRAFT_139775 [Phyllosticta citribraziliensis]|uniref:Uncharacterized protein n=1 Tax=Phyllosticta citribraziliensis TaxID=989973 RepID=A0ABR1L6J8_9PEZI